MTKTEKFLGKEEYRHWQLHKQEDKIACLNCKFACFSIIHNINPIARNSFDGFDKKQDDSRELICECEAKFNAIKVDKVEIVSQVVDKDDIMERKINVYSFFDKQKVISQCMKFTKDDEPELDLD